MLGAGGQARQGNCLTVVNPDSFLESLTQTSQLLSFSLAVSSAHQTNRQTVRLSGRGGEDVLHAARGLCSYSPHTILSLAHPFLNSS
ncbi:hypothetical protein Pcinc_028873 [Petrolisthes cinctipes]|uniref:Uncharacterized protein n=1 Tax=Petrolisthes cinctipes TaxID=88211 RepID=A0AAE1F165_PETCI|nr:hypothetical protein Pcinc_028873 [Petrolisthes cinctipes]